MSRFILFTMSLFLLMSCSGNLFRTSDDQDIVVRADGTEIVKINVALLVPLNKKKEYIGASIVKSAQLAIEDSNYIGVDLIILDSDKVNNAPEALLSELDKHQVKVIIGPLYSAETRKLVDLIKDKDITILSLSNDSSIKSDSLLMMGITPDIQAHAVVDYAVSKGIASFHLILPKNKLGHLINGAAEYVLAEKSGISYTANWYNSATEEQVINRVVSSFDDNHDHNNHDQAIFMPQGDNSLVYLDKALTKYKPHVSLIGLQSWDNNAILGLSNFNGAILLRKNLGNDKFYKRFNNVFQSSASNIDFIAYNSLVMIIKMYHAQLELDKQSIITNNKEGSQYSDVYFSPEGLSFYNLSITEIKDKHFISIENNP